MMENVLNGMRAIHPGEILREEFLVPMEISANALAIVLQVPAPRINDIVRERRGITADTALRLARYFGTSAEFWLGLQDDYDLKIRQKELAGELDRIVPRRAA
jgi:addiction module HigA family antidote